MWTKAIFLCLVTVVGVLAPLPFPTNTTIIGNPTGHCFPRCTCVVDGRYFSPGERWTDPWDPCTVNECQQNGTVRPVYRGCSFNGICRDVQTNWTEDCVTYECVEGQHGSFFTLIGAGCRTKDGGCKMVGEVMTEGCDKLQCRVLDGALTWNVLSTGCKIGNECKREKSYWHNGCTIYTCDRQNGLAKEKALTQDVMYWPEGDYALFKRTTGCPVDVQSNWADGYRKHYSIGRNYFPVEPQLAGQFTPTFFAFEFCTHVSNNNPPNQTNRYITYWEPGHYCIFRSGGVCPRGFSDGYLEIDDHDSKSHLSDVRGSIPDGDYGTNTGFFFCCRNDGPVSGGIVLPKENSFALLMGTDATECQNVKGMEKTVEKYVIDGSLFSKHSMNGSIPRLDINNGDITLSVCLYQPQICGCPDGLGNHVQLHQEKTINCVRHKCASVNGTSVLLMIKGGCDTEGQCREEGAVWSLFSGEACTKHTCSRVTDVNGTRFEVEVLLAGCKDGTSCLLPGTEVYRECATSQCVPDGQTNKHVLKTIRSDCPWSQSCQPVNSTWRHGCMTYRCENQHNADNGYQQWNIEPVEYGCNDGSGTCYKVGEIVNGTCYQAECKINSNKSMVYMDVLKGGCLWKNTCKRANETWRDGCHNFQCQWTDGNTGYTAVTNATAVSCEWKGKCYNESEQWTENCIDYMCRVTRRADEVNWSVESVKLGCRDFKKRCVSLGGNMTDRCVTYECKKWGDKLGLEPVSVGCKWKGKCHLENSTWDDQRRCVTYLCKKKTVNKDSVMQISLVDYGCTFNGTCKKVNATWPDGCRTRKCVVTRTNQKITRSVAPVSAGCDDEGLCRPVGYKKVSNSCMEYECLFNEELKDSYFTLAAGACRSRDNVCHKVNSTWTDKTSEMCLNYECRREPVGFLSKMIEQQCRDADGVCRRIGSIGFPATVNGILKSDCKCVRTFENNSGIAIQCKQ